MLACKKCSFGSGDTATAEFFTTSQRSFARGYEYTVTTSSGYARQNSSLQGFILAPPSNYFRGLSKPTALTLDTYQTTYMDLLRGETLTGFHIDFSSVKLGDLVSSRNFSQVNGIYFQFVFAKNSATLEVELSQKKSIPTMLLGLMGSLVGLVNTFGLVLVYSERGWKILMTCYDKYRSKKNGNIQFKKDQIMELRSPLFDSHEL
jgi:hypothetical protein